MSKPADPPPINRTMITVSIMLATIMTTLDATIANVALPRMAGSLSASGDQITWVLTSYIIAAAVLTPVTGWLAGRFGRKTVFTVCIIGFTVTSALCGIATSLAEMVVFRVLQGAFGAAMVPLSQAVMLDTYSIEERGRAMAMWGMGVMVSPIIGPLLGGWLTDNFSWRWVFFINLPVGVISLLGVMRFIPSEAARPKVRFDLLGFALLSVALIAFQLMLDRGQQNGWFDSVETVLEATVATTALGVFVVHTFSTDKPFLPIELLEDRNYVMSCLLVLVMGVLMFSSLALIPPMMQGVMGYPVIDTGLITAPRGIGSMLSIYIAGRLVKWFDLRLIIAAGLGLFAIGFWGMSHMSLTMDSSIIVWTGAIQGLGMGLVFVPMTTLAFATIPASYRGDATGVFTLIRTIGNSAGISIMMAVFTTNTQVVHSRLVEKLTPDNPMMGALAGPAGLGTQAGVAALNSAVTRQSVMVAYIDVFHLLFWITLIALPLIFFVQSPKEPTAPRDDMVLD